MAGSLPRESSSFSLLLILLLLLSLLLLSLLFFLFSCPSYFSHSYYYYTITSAIINVHSIVVTTIKTNSKFSCYFFVFLLYFLSCRVFKCRPGHHENVVSPFFCFTPCLSLPDSQVHQKCYSVSMFRVWQKLGLASLQLSGKKKEPKPKLFGPDIFGWGGGLPREGVGTKKLDMSFETLGNQLFFAGNPVILPGYPGGARKV